MKERRLYKLGVGAGLATMVLGAMLAIAPVAGANHEDPPGFNGTVKVDGLAANDGPGHSNRPNDPSDDGTDNDPHVDCGLQLEFFNFDHHEVADITITVQPPTGSGGVVYSAEDVVVSDDDAGGAGQDSDATIDLAVHDDVDLTAFEAHPQHGWHVMLEVNIFRVLPNGREMVGQKHKVFWIEPCVPTGSLSVDKDVVGNDQPVGTTSFPFTVSCTSGGAPVTLAAGDASFSLTDDAPVKVISGLPVGSVCTVTETDDRDADSTTYRIGTGATTTGTSASGATIADGATTAVLFTNRFDTTVVNPTGSLSVDKDVVGNDQPVGTTSFPFTVSCTSGGAPVTLAAGDASFSLTDDAPVKVISGLPVGSVCTVTETDDRDADSTTYRIGTGATTTGTSASGATIADGVTTAVLFTNRFDTTPPPPTVTEYSVDIDKVNDADEDTDFSNVETADQAGDDVVFQITIRNTGDGALVVQSLRDVVPGRATVDLLGDAVDLVCTGAVTDLQVGSVLPVGSVTVCTFELEGYAPSAGDSLTNTVRIVTDQDDDSDSSTVETEEVDVVVLPNPPVERPPAVPPLQPVPAVPPALTPPAQTPPAVAPSAALPAAEVRGDVVTRPLARTGDDTRDVAGMGAFLVALGAAMVLASRRQLVRR